MSTKRNHDLAIIGTGPAGLALAAEALDLGARVVMVDPAPRTDWVPTWCTFEDDLPAGVPVKRRWVGADVRLDRRTLAEDRPYVEIDGPALQRQLHERAQDADIVPGTVRGRTPNGVALADGTTLEAAQVVDCSGAAQVLGGAGRPSAFQTAYGLEITTRGHPWDPQRAMWMDLTSLEDPPTFLYALPHDHRRVFVEETALAARPEVPLSVLETRLHQRLERLGIDIVETHAVERCRIPLDMPEPTGLAFGSAGGMVHPSTGYLLTRVLHGARGYAVALSRGDDAAKAQSRRLQGGLARDLHLLGLDVLVQSDGATLSDFFHAFFAMPPRSREAFLAVQPRLLPTVIAMSRMFVSASWTLKRHLAAPLFTARAPVPEAACPHS